jgi:transposase-like protein
MPKARTFSAEFKAQIVLEVISGAKTSGEVCRQHQIHPKLFARWKSIFLEQAPTIFNQEQTRSAEQERIAELERMIGRLTMELEVAKKASSLLGSTLSRNGQ